MTQQRRSSEIVVEVWGDYACITRPECKVERMTYSVLTPSAARGILSSIFNKPREFYWQVKRIEILKPIKRMTIVRNEIKNGVVQIGKPISIESERTQRQTEVLRDVRYRIVAEIVERDDCLKDIKGLYKQAKDRIHKGKCFQQPYFGLREYVCYFEGATDMEPVDVNFEELMLYDVYNIEETDPTKIAISLYKAKVEHGVLQVPRYEDNRVLKV